MRHLIMLCILVSLLSACVNTDALLPHQIIAVPQNKWVGFEEETPLDVTDGHQVTSITCTDARAE